MDFLRRFGFYLLGLCLGIPMVIFIWKGKGTTFDYGLDARTLKQIRVRKRVFSEQAKQTMFQNNIDTTQISLILKNGDVDFGKSKARIKPCPEYLITSENIDLYIVRCDSTATIEQVLVK